MATPNNLMPFALALARHGNKPVEVLALLRRLGYTLGDAARAVRACADAGAL